jgi:hypothetical protein
MDSIILAPMITVAAFIMGTVLSNVMSDYKESEKIPAEMTGYFVTIMSFSRTEAKRYGKSAVPLLKEVEAMLLAVMATVDAQRAGTQEATFHDALMCFEDAWQEYCRLVIDMCHEGGGHCDLEHVQHAQIEITKKWARINDISTTSIALPAYMMMDLITCLLVGVLVSVVYKEYDENSGYWVCGLFGTIVIYLNLFVRTLDDPFEWPTNFWFESYINGAMHQAAWKDTMSTVCNVDLSSLFIHFGGALRKYINDPACDTIAPEEA